ncbi:unnamed protein product [Amoebophrya sp. A25]|nr:unnamed protein product [Amoebophrya sp. A25]|eukprot:GSA25T00001354001.1
MYRHLPSDVKGGTVTIGDLSDACTLIADPVERSMHTVWKKAHRDCPWRLAYQAGYDAAHATLNTATMGDDKTWRCGPKHGHRVCWVYGQFCDEIAGVCRDASTYCSPSDFPADAPCRNSKYNHAETTKGDCALANYPENPGVDNFHMDKDSAAVPNATGMMLTYGDCTQSYVRDLGEPIRPLAQAQSTCGGELPGCSDSCTTALNGICEDGEAQGPDGTAGMGSFSSLTETGISSSAAVAAAVGDGSSSSSSSFDVKKSFYASFYGPKEPPVGQQGITRKTKGSVALCPRGTDCTDCGVREGAWRRIVHSQFFESGPG